MSYLFAATSPCELTPEQRRQTERDHPGLWLPDEGRLPSRLDFEAVAAAHPEWRVQFDQGSTWLTVDVQSASQGTSLYIASYSGDPTRGHHFYFDRGDPDLVVEVAAALAERCGSLLVAGEGGDILVLVNPDGSRSDLGETQVCGSRPPTRVTP